MIRLFSFAAVACCVADCVTEPPPIANAKWQCGVSTPHGHSCNATCNEGFAGSPSALCLKPDVWSNVTGSCRATGDGCVRFHQPPFLAKHSFPNSMMT